MVARLACIKAVADGRAVHTLVQTSVALGSIVYYDRPSEQAAAAARAVIAWMPADVALMRALETGMAVSYARPFVDATLPRARLSKSDRPTSEGERELHDLLLWFRRIYAHTDAESGRNASPVMPPEGDGLTASQASAMARPGNLSRANAKARSSRSAIAKRNGSSRKRCPSARS